MKLKRRVEIVFIIIAIISGIVMMYDMEKTMLPFLIGGTIFLISCHMLSEYGTLLEELITKLDEKMSK